MVDNKLCYYGGWGMDIAVICDFDGTISVKDVNVSVFQEFGGESVKEVENSYRNSRIGLRESLYTQYRIIGIDEAAFKKYVYEKMELDTSFFDFYDYARDNGIEVVIVSGGFINYVEILFAKYNRKMDMPIFSNKLGVENGIILPQYGDVPECSRHFGPCGICKYKHITEYKKKYKVVYVGDGHTDRCAAESADAVFAKENLAVFCKENDIKYTDYKSFSDVKNYLSDKKFLDNLKL